MQQHDWNELDELTVEQLGFSALSDGLGFAKPATPPSLGLGATAAGPAMPVAETPKVVFKSETKKTPEPKAAVISEPAASIGLRAFAFATDVAIALAPWALAIAFVLPDSVRDAWFLAEKKSFVPLLALYLFSYFLLTESMGGQSLGKMLLKLQIVEDDKYQKPIAFRAALPRLITFLLCLLPCGLGLVSGFFDSKRRSLHDKVTGTIIRRI